MTYTYAAVKRYRAKHPERYRKQQKTANAKQRSKPGVAENSALVAKEWRSANPERARLVKEAYRKTHRAEVNARQASWKKKNRGKVNANGSARRARKLGALCSCCTSEMFANFHVVAALVGYDVEHIVPLADGGPHCIKNLQWLSPEAHRVKTSAENSRRSRR